MKPLIQLTLSIICITCVAGGFVVADQPEPLPDQYAEVVLHVEGMI